RASRCYGPGNRRHQSCLRMGVNRSRRLRLAGALLVMLGSATATRVHGAAPVDPIIPGLHSTGVTNDDKKLKAGDPDPHFHVTGPVSGTPRVIGPNDIPSDWINRQDNSQWISIANDTVAPA